ncbi:MAG: nucleoside hydrolase [Candidatus Sumerlaeota bacterium]
MSEKIIFDTDIGSDIDDAVALAYLLARDDVDLLGITTVSGQAMERAKLASAICRVADADVPIYPGIEKPIFGESRQPHAPQAQALDNWPHDREFPQNEAIAFMQKTIRENPGEVTLLAVGPMTNLGVLFALDPALATMLKRLVLMCGRFITMPSGKPMEWNAMNDPTATAIVFDQKPPVFRSVGLDVTTQVRMAKDEVLKRFDAPLLRPVVDFAGVWFEHQDKITFHDPLAADIIFEEDICTWRNGTVHVERDNAELNGATFLHHDADAPLEIADTVDVDRFFEHYFSVFK